MLDLLNDFPNGRMGETQAAFYLYQIVCAVDFMHEKALCHRDIKLENCVVETETQAVKIIDFGLANELDAVETLK